MLKKIAYSLLVIFFLIVGGIIVFKYFPGFRMPYLFTAFLTVLHYYVWTAVKVQLKKLNNALLFSLGFVFWLPIILLIIGGIALSIEPMDLWSPFLKIYFIGIIFTFIVSLILPVVFIFMADILRIFQTLKQFAKPKKNRKSKGISRQKFLVNTGLALGGLVLGGMSFGMMRGNYH
ncbi:MAG: hypothetical protein V1783_09315, partial [Bacteroidota bacterium]